MSTSLLIITFGISGLYITKFLPFFSFHLHPKIPASNSVDIKPYLAVAQLQTPGVNPWALLFIFCESGLYAVLPPKHTQNQALSPTVLATQRDSEQYPLLLNIHTCCNPATTSHFVLLILCTIPNWKLQMRINSKTWLNDRLFTWDNIM